MISVPTDPALHRVFDLAAWGAGLSAGLLVSRWRLAAARAAVPRRHGYFIALAAGAILGAYLAGTLPTLAAGAPALSHSIIGALAGAILAVELFKAANGLTGSTGGVFVAPFAVGVVIGRWGCLFTGLRDGTFGAPTSLAWGVDLGDGIARHPVQIYESAAMLAFVSVYLAALRRRADWATSYGFYYMTMWYALQRFFWEFLKPYPSVIGPFNLFHFVCAGLFIYGFVWLARARRAAAAR